MSSTISNEPKENEECTSAKRSCLDTGKNGATTKPPLDWIRGADRFNLLVACTGSVAAIKIPELLSEIQKACPKHQDQLHVRLIATENALKFFVTDELKIQIFDDKAEWSTWQQRGDPILHIELRKWADMILIAPLDANTLAKIATGLCDNLVTSVVRAWDFRRPAYFCPAMNTFMWQHPLTMKHMDVLKGLLGFREIPCVEKELMCGDKGQGAMASVQMIASVVASEINKHFAIYSG